MNIVNLFKALILAGVAAVLGTMAFSYVNGQAGKVRRIF